MQTILVYFFKKHSLKKWLTFCIQCKLEVNEIDDKYIQVVKGSRHKAALPPQMEASIIFARLCQCALSYEGMCQCALPWRHIGATWQIRFSLCFLRPSRVHNPNGKSISSAISVQLFLHRVSHYLTTGCLFPLKITPSHVGSRPNLIHYSLDPSEPTTQTASWSVQLFLHRWLQSVPILYNRTPIPPQNCPFPCRDLDPIEHMVPRAHPSS